MSDQPVSSPPGGGYPDANASGAPPGGYPVGKGPDPKRAALFMKLGIISENGAYMPKARVTQEEPTMTGMGEGSDQPGSEATPSPSASFDIQMDEKPIKPKDDFRVAYLKRLSKEGIWLPPDKRPPKHQIVIIFDWDDTLLCTSFLNCRGIHQLPKNMTAVLDQLQEKAANLLDIALSLSSHCFIITNAMKGWVEYSCEKFVPKLMPYLDKMEVISARTDHEQEFPQNFHEWKNQAFLNVQKKLHQQIIANLISLGDSNFEMEAVHVMGAEFQQALIKTIKFRESPTPEELVKQLELVSSKFEKIVHSARNLKIGLERKYVPSASSPKPDKSGEKEDPKDPKSQQAAASAAGNLSVVPPKNAD